MPDTLVTVLGLSCAVWELNPSGMAPHAHQGDDVSSHHPTLPSWRVVFASAELATN